MTHPNRILRSIVLGAIVGTLAATALADTVEIPVGQQGEASVERPPRGVNKTQVEAVYGAPEAKHGPTGNPPIYVWEYPQYMVYFEGDHVIHTVLKHQKRE